MRHPLHIILAALMLAAAVGCGRGVDRRLVLADTLMWTAPDSSLAILTAVNRDSLQGDENRAYHALLLTQAQFRCNGNCTTDTLINSALEYYKDNHNREHYTRALLYKGTYYEERTNPVEAMKWYKQAEDNADTTDYRNLAQINMRIGMLYYYNYAGNNIDLEKFKKALHSYSKLNDSTMMMVCHGYLGNLYRKINQDSARFYLNKDLGIAKVLNDSSEMFEATLSLATTYLNDSNYLKVIELTQYCLDNYSNYINDYCYYTISRAFCGLKQPHKAKEFFDRTSNPGKDLQLKSVRLLTESEILQCEGFFTQSRHCYELYNQLADSVESNEKLYSLVKNEDDIQDNLISKKSVQLSRSRLFLLSFIVSFVLIAAISIFVAYRLHRRKIINMQCELQSSHDVSINKQQALYAALDKVMSDLRVSEMNYSAVKSANEAMRKILSSHLALMHDLIQASQNLSANAFGKTFNKAVNRYHDDSSMHKVVENYVKAFYGSIAERINNTTPSLTKQEKQMVNMVVIGFDYIDVAVVMGMPPKTVSGKFTRIARKMQSTNSLKKLIEQLKNQA